MKGNEYVEHRRAPRVSVDLPVLRKIDRRYVPEKALNLSASGIALATQVPLVPGSLESLVLVSKDGTVEVPLQAEVIRVQTTPSKQSAYIAGLRFAALDTSSTSQIEALMLAAMRQPSGHRAAQRVELHAEAFWSGPGSAGSKSLEMVNFSETGAQIRGDDVPDANARGLFSVRHEQSGEMITVPAEIVWSKDHLAGVRFQSHGSAADFITQLVRSFLFLPRSAPEAVAEVGSRIGGFTLGALWTRGRVSEVFRARALNPADTAGAEEVVLKRYQGPAGDVEQWTQRFLSAVDIGHLLHEHPGVARVFSAIGDARECWLASELVNGSSLEEGLGEVARKGQSVPIDAVVSVVREVLATLDDCHRWISARDGRPIEVVHGDVRSSNILIDRAGNVKLTGFGSPLRRTPEYLPWLPPEALFLGVPTPQTDVYQVGVVLYEALTGVLPFRGDLAEDLATAIALGPVPPSKLNRSVPAHLDAVVLMALAEDPDKRWHGCAQFADALAQLHLHPDALEVAQRRVTLVRTREITTERAVHPPEAQRILPSPPTRFQKGKPLTPWTPARSALKDGEVVGRYEILGKLAEGGMGEVFLARGPLEKVVVLKTVSSALGDERDVVTRFLTEARLASIINHGNVAQIHDVGFDTGRPFMVMEYVEGHTVDEVLTALEDRKERLTPELAATIAAECCAGLDHAHALRVVHRDVSAKNVMIAFQGSVKLLDFGIAQAVGAPSLQKPGVVRGTSGYVAPEQLKNDPVTGNADMWAVGVNLYRMLTGVMPFTGATDFQIFEAICTGEPVPAKELRPDAPDMLCMVIDRCLRKSPSERPSAMALKGQLEKYLDGKKAGPEALAELMRRLYPFRPRHPNANSREASVK